MSVSTNISGELRQLVGPDGQDLLINPLKVRINIITSQEQTTQDLIDQRFNLQPNANAKDLTNAIAVSKTKDLQIIQAQRAV